MANDDVVGVGSNIVPFDIGMMATEDGLLSLQSRISRWLRSNLHPIRFMAYTRPADLKPRIDYVGREALMTEDRHRQTLLQEYRRFYEFLQKNANYQNMVATIISWVERGQNEKAVTRQIASTFQTPAYEGAPAPLWIGKYALSEPNRDFREWHLKPVGSPGGRKYWAFLVSHEFHPVQWNFFKPFPQIFSQNTELAVCVDVPKTYSRDEAITKLEQVLLAYEVHFATKGDGRDSRGEKKMRDANIALQEINDGQGMHEVQVIIAVSGNNLTELSLSVAAIRDIVKPYFSVRVEVGKAQLEAAKFFSNRLTKEINIPKKTWAVTSNELALFFAPLGQRKMGEIRGVLRGEALGAGYPVWHDSWDERKGKQATHELWVGRTGSGKTFALNCYLNRGFTEFNVPFDVLEPMGHTKLLSEALGLPWFNLSSSSSIFNPLDPMFVKMIDQVSHVIAISETLLGRTFAGSQRGNQEKAVLGQAVERLYSKLGGIDRVDSENAPIMEDLVGELYKLGDREHLRAMSQALADELGGLATGAGPYASMINGRTNVRLAFGNEPRLFCFKELNSDPVLLGIAYTQVLAAIRRDSLADASPRVIAVDEVYRLLSHPSLLDFIVEGVKTLRTQRKKLLMIDQNMSIFVDSTTDPTGKMRLIFENCPIRVIFNQREGIETLRQDAAFAHFHENHFRIIRDLDRGQFLFDVEGHGLLTVLLRPSSTELARFGGS